MSAPGGGGPAPAPRDSHAAVAWAGRLLVLGGDDARDEAAEFRKDVWAFDPARRAWSEIQVGACWKELIDMYALAGGCVGSGVVA